MFFYLIVKFKHSKNVNIGTAKQSLLLLKQTC